jgi:hypothetical protein
MITWTPSPDIALASPQVIAATFLKHSGSPEMARVRLQFFRRRRTWSPDETFRLEGAHELLTKQLFLMK